MPETYFRLPIHLPAQGSAETEATIIEWYVREGDEVAKGQALAQIDSAKSVFEFYAPCGGKIIKLLFEAGQTVPYDRPVLEIETDDPAMRDWIPPLAAATLPQSANLTSESQAQPKSLDVSADTVSLLGLGGYLPERTVSNAELIQNFPGISEDYVYQVTGIRNRHWAADGERPSDLAYRACVAAIKDARITAERIGAIVVATTTPDVAMPATACFLQAKLGLTHVPAFDLNAACSGWLYALSVARGMLLSQLADVALVVGVDVQSRLLDRRDPTTCFLFGDGAGAAVIGRCVQGHRIHQVVLGADARGLNLARRFDPGFVAANGQIDADPWIRLEGQPLFRMATEGFAAAIRQVLEHTGWALEEINWIVPHQANTRILRAAAKRAGIPFERFFLNIEHVGNTSSASIPLALLEMNGLLQPGDKLVLCSVGAGLTIAAATMEW